MPIGSAKVGVLGAGLVCAGSTTFNASGTFTVPPGVTKVNITGKGGTGNPGNSGNPGNAGNPGTGGGGGGGGSSYSNPCRWCPGARGGYAFQSNPVAFYPGIPCSAYRTSGNGGSGTTPGNAGQGGIAGNAGSAGTAGSAGNTGGTSSGLCKSFTGGAGGNAGAAGNAGTAGAAGQAGGGGSSSNGAAQPGTGGNAGCGGGFGGTGTTLTGPSIFVPTGLPGCCSPSVSSQVYGGLGGGGAGSVNPGTGAPGGGLLRQVIYVVQPGGTGQLSTNAQAICAVNLPGPAYTVPANQDGGSGGRSGGQAAWSAISGGSTNPGGGFFPPTPNNSRRNTCQWNPAPLRPSLFRAGGGGGSSGSRGYPGCQFWSPKPCGQWSGGGGGGGGGRGGAGGAGGTQVAGNPGSAATPQTFNCLSVTPGAPYPITVATPGGQIVISWNAQ